MKGKRTLVLFDFDGTLTTQDTLFSFTRFAVGQFRFSLGLLILAPLLALFKLKLLSTHKTKEIFITHFFGGMEYALFANLGVRFTKEILPGLIREQALTMIRSYAEAGARMTIVSASAEEWIRPWAQAMGMDVIATNLEVKDHKVTGKIKGENCNGEEKVNRIRAFLEIGSYDLIIAYGDSKGDGPMLSLATQKFYKPFRD